MGNVDNSEEIEKEQSGKAPVDELVSHSSVFLLTSGDGSDGYEWQVISIHRTKESAEKSKIEYEKPRPRRTTGFYSREANIEEWNVEG